MDRTNELEAIKFTEKVLDTIDLKAFIEYHCELTLAELMDLIEDEYLEEANNEIMNGHIFNWINEVEFGEYLSKRYPYIYIREVVKTYVSFLK